MAKIKKLSQGGSTIYPATILEAVVNRSSNKTLAADLLTIVKSVNSGSTTPDAALAALTALGTGYNSLVSVATTLKDFLTGATNSDNVINKWKEVEAFLSGIKETQSLTGLLQQNLNSAKEYVDSLREEIQTDYDEKLSDAVTMDDVQKPENAPSGGILLHEGGTNTKKAYNSGVTLTELRNPATQSAAGLMSADDKAKLDGFDDASEYITTEACTDVTDYAEVTI